MLLPLKEKGGSSSMDEEERSFVGRSLMTNACPPNAMPSTGVNELQMLLLTNSISRPR